MAILAKLTVSPAITDGGVSIADGDFASAETEVDFVHRQSLRLNGGDLVLTAGTGALATWGNITGFATQIQSGTVDITYLAAGAEPCKLVAGEGPSVVAMNEVDLEYLAFGATGMVTGSLIVWGRLP